MLLIDTMKFTTSTHLTDIAHTAEKWQTHGMN